MNEDFVKRLNFPIEVVSEILDKSDLQIFDWKTEDMLKNQMRTFGLTVSDIESIAIVEGKHEIFISNKGGKPMSILERKIEENRGILTYRYEKYKRKEG